MPKHRIMSRSEIAEQLTRQLDRTESLVELASLSLMFHMLADNDKIKIYNDRNMGGTIVEY